MTKFELIKLIERNENRIDESVFVNDDRSGNKLGLNQFRELAEICASAECFEEIELLMGYNIAKDKDKNSWAKEKDGVSVGKVILGCMKEIEEKSKKDGDNVLKNLSLFFGYMYWKARIWAAERSQYNKRGNK